MKLSMASLVLCTLPVTFAFSGSYLDKLSSMKPAEASYIDATVVPDAPTIPANEIVPEETPSSSFFMEEDVKEKASTSPSMGGASMTERMLKKVPSENQTGGAGGSSSFEAFKRAEENWTRLKSFKAFDYDSKFLRWNQNGNPPPKQFVASDGAFGNPKCWAKLSEQKNKELDFDAVVIGGTLGIFYATYLQMKGHDVCVVEAGKLRGREQEWNISMDEIMELVKLGVLTQEDVDAVITTEFPACRSGFKNKEVTPLEGGYFENGVGFECVTPGVLNL